MSHVKKTKQNKTKQNTLPGGTCSLPGPLPTSSSFPSSDSPPGLCYVVSPEGFVEGGKSLSLDSVDTSSSRSNSPQLLGDALSYEQTPSRYPKPVPSLPRHRSYATDWEEIMPAPFYHPPTQPGRCCHLVLKIEHPDWAFMVLLGTRLLLSHTWSLPLLGPVQLLDQLSTSSQGPLGEMWDQADLWVWPWLRLSAMAPSHSPAALPQPMQLRLGRSVFYLHPSLLSHPINPPFLDALGGHPYGGAGPVPPSLSEPPLNS
jgi:hypothetical protein